MTSRKARTGAKRVARVREDPPPKSNSMVYVESSALVAAMLEQDEAVRIALSAPARHTTSSITIAETARALVRARATRRIDEETYVALSRDLAVRSAHYAFIPISEVLLARVSRPFPVEPVRTLDAIHLASIEGLGLPPGSVAVLTRDKRIAANCRALGYTVS